jgi:trans-aconitate methyltransferase
MLFRGPITKHPQRVFHIGTGTGIWAIDSADEFPSALLIGNDLSPIQPSWVPPNYKFIADDLESPWLYKRSELLDFIHGRAIAASTKDWPRLYRQINMHLKPEGWVKMQEYEGVLRSDDDPELHNTLTIVQRQKLVDEATTKMGQKLDVDCNQKQFMIDAEFVDVRDDVYKVCVIPIAEPLTNSPDAKSRCQVAASHRIPS